MQYPSLDVDDDADDLLAAPGSDHEDAPTTAARTTPGRGRRWLQSRWSLPLLVTLMVALAGVAGVRQARSTAAADLDLQRRLVALQLQEVQTAYDSGPTRHDPSGALLLPTQVPLVNTGDAPVRVSVVRSSAAPVSDAGRTLALSPGESGLLTPVLAVDCSAERAFDDSGVVVLDPASGAVLEPDWLDLRVTVEGRTRTHRYQVGSGWGSVSASLSYLCDPWWNGGAEASTTVDGEGHLLVEVTGPPDAPTDLTLDAATALGATSDTPLPTTVPAGGQLAVAFSLHPDCARLASGGITVETRPSFAVSRVVSAEETREVTDQLTTAAWVARQVALACG